MVEPMLWSIELPKWKRANTKYERDRPRMKAHRWRTCAFAALKQKLCIVHITLYRNMAVSRTFLGKTEINNSQKPQAAPPIPTVIILCHPTITGYGINGVLFCLEMNAGVMQKFQIACSSLHKGELFRIYFNAKIYPTSFFTSMLFVSYGNLLSSSLCKLK